MKLHTHWQKQSKHGVVKANNFLRTLQLPNGCRISSFVPPSSAFRNMYLCAPDGTVYASAVQDFKTRLRDTDTFLNNGWTVTIILENEPLKITKFHSKRQARDYLIRLSKTFTGAVEEVA